MAATAWRPPSSLTLSTAPSSPTALLAHPWVPLLAVPYVAYVPNTRLGAHFQVMAYDQDYYLPELRDEVRFFLGNSREHGGTQANMVYTLNTADLSANVYAGEYTWFQDYYYKYICARGVAEGRHSWRQMRGQPLPRHQCRSRLHPGQQLPGGLVLRRVGRDQEHPSASSEPGH